ncbi:hypothetical protein [Pseudomonas sp. MWU13-2100]|uniref:hypothetical protein n=1 Tax=Pseudomonas sp. MWU13-2100 TaxID=2935075 RepID=UPI00200CE9D1|nr:hypothetical protein [Pseudomonas sp. MWU13-2100]
MGQKFAAYDANGDVIAYYDDIDSPVPGGVTAIEITEAQWLGCISSQGWRVSDGTLVEPVPPTSGELLVEAQRVQTQVIDSACASAITAGFSCDALVSGTPYHYPSNITDQANLSASVLASLLPGNAADWVTPFWCADERGVWGYRLHTMVQIQLVGACGKTAITGFIGHKIVLDGQIKAATTVDAVQAVSWS